MFIYVFIIVFLCVFVFDPSLCSLSFVSVFVFCLWLSLCLLYLVTSLSFYIWFIFVFGHWTLFLSFVCHCLLSFSLLCVFGCIVSFICLFPSLHYCFLPYTSGIEEKKDWLYTSFKKVVSHMPFSHPVKHPKGSQNTHFQSS